MTSSYEEMYGKAAQDSLDEWLRLARESNARSPKRVDEWIVFFNEREELVYAYIRYDRLTG